MLRRPVARADAHGVIGTVATNPGGAGTVPLSPEAIQQLSQLAELTERGVLTEEEFAAPKAAILGT